MSGDANAAASKALLEMGTRFCKRCFQYRPSAGGQEFNRWTGAGNRLMWNCESCKRHLSEKRK